MRSGAGGRRSRCDSVLTSGRPPPAVLRQHQRVVVFGDGDHLVAAREGGIHRRIEEHVAVGAHHAHDGRVFVGRDHFAVRAAGEPGLGLEVDLRAVEIQQLGVDHRQPRLAAGLRGDACDQVLALHVDGFLAAHQRRRLEIPRFADLRDDVIRLVLARRVVGDGEHRLDNVDVGVFGLGRQHDDRARRMRIDHREVVEIERIAAAADDARVRGARELGADIVFHLDLVALGQDHDAGILLVRVGDEQLADDRIDLARPAEDQREILFDDARAALAQFSEARLEAGGDGADEDADDEDAADGDDQHEQAELPAVVAGHHARVERARACSATCPRRSRRDVRDRRGPGRRAWRRGPARPASRWPWTAAPASR